MDFTQVASFTSRLEAETVAHTLDKYQIPFMIKSNDLGVFIPGSNSASPQGALLLVPEDCVEKVNEVLAGIV